MAVKENNESGESRSVTATDLPCVAVTSPSSYLRVFLFNENGYTKCLWTDGRITEAEDLCRYTFYIGATFSISNI